MNHIWNFSTMVLYPAKIGGSESNNIDLHCGQVVVLYIVNAD